MTLGLYQLVKMPLEPDPPSLVRKTIENRESNFLDLMRRAVFDHPANPYHALFQWAGCTYGDLEQTVRKNGLEPALVTLQKTGVYLTHDEFKGKKPVERSGKQIVVEPTDFANPLVKGVMEASSSGSRSSGTITRRSVEFQIYREAQERVFFDEFPIWKKTHVRVSSILPSTGGLRRAVLMPRRGQSIDRWFVLGGVMRDSAHYRFVTNFLMLEARLLGVKATFPTFLPQNDFTPVARWLARRRSEGAECALSTGVSNAVRVAAAAVEEGLDISGVVVKASGEALTDAKRAVIEAAGAKPYPSYAISEFGKIGGSCMQMTKGNSVHICRDSVALISRRKHAPLTDVEVDSLMFTSLLPCAATVLVNVEMDDAGVIGPAKCDCSLRALGYTQQVSDIFSYGKLTGQGMTLVGQDVLNILEERMPARFGGAPTDYQLVEQEGSHQTEIELRVHPRVSAGSAEEMRRYFLAELKQVYGGSLSSRNWSQTNGMKVVFGEPYHSGAKVHALHLLGTGRQQRRAR
ncbi:MAG: hypothetical protein GY953_56055 [bacterium]|nr:hypothetical protein [bacterium]